MFEVWAEFINSYFYLIGECVVFDFICFIFKYLIHFSLFTRRNLTKRAEKRVDCKINHIKIRNDNLVFRFAKSKGH